MDRPRRDRDRGPEPDSGPEPDPEPAPDPEPTSSTDTSESLSCPESLSLGTDSQNVTRVVSPHQQTVESQAINTQQMNVAHTDVAHTQEVQPEPLCTVEQVETWPDMPCCSYYDETTQTSNGNNANIQVWTQTSPREDDMNMTLADALFLSDSESSIYSDNDDGTGSNHSNADQQDENLLCEPEDNSAETTHAEMVDYLLSRYLELQDQCRTFQTLSGQDTVFPRRVAVFDSVLNRPIEFVHLPNLSKFYNNTNVVRPPRPIDANTREMQERVKKEMIDIFLQIRLVRNDCFWRQQAAIVPRSILKKENSSAAKPAAKKTVTFNERIYYDMAIPGSPASHEMLTYFGAEGEEELLADHRKRILSQLDVTPLRELAFIEDNPYSWHIVVDFEVLLTEFRFLNVLVDSDEASHLMLPLHVMEQLRTFVDTSNNISARRILRILDHQIRTCYTFLAEGPSYSAGYDPAVVTLTTCLEMMKENYHVILICQDRELLSHQNTTNVHMFTVNEVKDMLNCNSHGRVSFRPTKLKKFRRKRTLVDTDKFRRSKVSAARYDPATAGGTVDDDTDSSENSYGNSEQSTSAITQENVVVARPEPEINGTVVAGTSRSGVVTCSSMVICHVSDTNSSTIIDHNTLPSTNHDISLPSCSAIHTHTNYDNTELNTELREAARSFEPVSNITDSDTNADKNAAFNTQGNKDDTDTAIEAVQFTSSDETSSTGSSDSSISDATSIESSNTDSSSDSSCSTAPNCSDTLAISFIHNLNNRSTGPIPETRKSILLYKAKNMEGSTKSKVIVIKKIEDREISELQDNGNITSKLGNEGPSSFDFSDIPSDIDLDDSHLNIDSSSSFSDQETSQNREESRDVGLAPDSARHPDCRQTYNLTCQPSTSTFVPQGSRGALVQNRREMRAINDIPGPAAAQPERRMESRDTHSPTPQPCSSASVPGASGGAHVQKVTAIRVVRDIPGPMASRIVALLDRARNATPEQRANKLVKKIIIADGKVRITYGFAGNEVVDIDRPLSYAMFIEGINNLSSRVRLCNRIDTHLDRILMMCSSEDDNNVDLRRAILQSNRQIAESNMSAISLRRIAQYVVIALAIMDDVANKTKEHNSSSSRPNPEQVEDRTIAQRCEAWIRNFVNLCQYTENPTEVGDDTIISTFTEHTNIILPRATVLHESMRLIGIRFRCPAIRYALLRISSMLMVGLNARGEMRSLDCIYFIYLCAYGSFVTELVKATRTNQRDIDLVEQWFLHHILDYCPALITLAATTMRDLISRHFDEPLGVSVAARAFQMATLEREEARQSGQAQDCQVHEVPVETEPTAETTTQKVVKKKKKKKSKKKRMKWISFPISSGNPAGSNKTTDENNEESSNQNTASDESGPNNDVVMVENPTDISTDNITAVSIEAASTSQNVRAMEPSQYGPSTSRYHELDSCSGTKLKEKTRRSYGDIQEHKNISKKDSKNQQTLKQSKDQKRHNKNKKNKNKKTHKKYTNSSNRARKKAERYFQPKVVQPKVKSDKNTVEEKPAPKETNDDTRTDEEDNSESVSVSEESEEEQIMDSFTFMIGLFLKDHRERLEDVSIFCDETNTELFPGPVTPERITELRTQSHEMLIELLKISDEINAAVEEAEIGLITEEESLFDMEVDWSSVQCSTMEEYCMHCREMVVCLRKQVASLEMQIQKILEKLDDD